MSGIYVHCTEIEQDAAMIFSQQNGNLTVPHIPGNMLPKDVSTAVVAKAQIPAALPARSLLLEGEDARLNGATRSLQRRLFGLNLGSARPMEEVLRERRAA